MPDARVTDVFERHESRVRSYCRSIPAVFATARGHHLWDTEGNRYVDLLCGAGALNYGHNPRPIVRRVAEYLVAEGPVQSLDLHTTAKAEFLHRFVTEILTPRGLGDHVVQFPGPAGTLAVEAALKLARKVTGRTTVVALHGGFHGASLGSLAATSSPLLRGGAGIPMPGVTFLPHPASADSVEAAVTELETTMQRERPAAVLLETVQGEGGLTVTPTGWLTEVRRVADEVGSLVIVDDIQAGCGRTGVFFSFEHVPAFTPDLVCLSKSLSGLGLPMAALLIRPDRDIWKPGEHNGTFRGNNLAFVAATAALDYWADPEFVGHAAKLAVAVQTSVREIVSRLPAGVAERAGRGSMSGLRFASAETAEQVRVGLYRSRVVAETSGGGKVLKLLPPLTMRLAEWEEIAGRLDDVVTRVVPDVLEVAV